MDPFERAVRETLIRRALLQRREPAVVALSGGPDSTALVAALSALGHPVRALHINHALDGGRILFTLPEIFFKKRIPTEWENMVNGIA
ncbi:MAG: hypothetical protein HUU15_06850, partial [Candidatus Brocadiae bacterium]|nr:hypothetical protein [Candidatus Brocadiia bacterium]